MAGGRPSKLTPELVAQTRELAAQGLPIGLVCQQLGVTVVTAWRWRNESFEDDESEENSLKTQFRKAIDDSGVQLAKLQIANLRNQAKDGNTQAATWLLTHHPATRDHFSDAAAERKTERRTVATVLEAVAATGLTPDQEHTLMLQMQARGLGAVQGEGEQ